MNWDSQFLTDRRWFFDPLRTFGFSRAFGLSIAVIGFCLTFCGWATPVSAMVEPRQVTKATGTQVVLSWQARSQSTEGEWRIYRSIDGQQFTLADTIDVTQGIQHYKFSDNRLRANLPTQVYQLRYVGSQGKETVVAVARCLDSGIEDSPATAPAHYNPSADLVDTALIEPSRTQTFLSISQPAGWQWTPQPEFPPPRVA